MSQKSPRSITPSGGGFFGDVSLRVKLIIRLMSDPRVNFLFKLLPLSTLVYFVFPDIVVGPVDDALIIWLGTYLFVELCPQEVVQEHMKQLRGAVPGGEQDAAIHDVVDAEFEELDDDHPAGRDS